MTFRFTDTVQAAQFAAELVRQGVTFKGEVVVDIIVITLTGGY